MTKDIAKIVSVPLKKGGFVKKGLTWNRNHGRLVQVVNLQRFRFSSAGKFSVTLNVGIWMEHVWKTCWFKAVPPVIKEEECFPRFRLARLLSNFSTKRKDHWWDGSSPDDAQKVGKELAVLIEDRVLPFLEQYKTEAEVKELVTANPSLVSQPVDKIYLAILAHWMGEKTLCAKLLDELKDKKLQAWEERANDVRRRLGHAM